MVDSLKYGVPGGLVSAFLFAMQQQFVDSASPYVRWLIACAIILTAAIYSIRQSNRAFFPFRYAFLSGFNVSIVMVLVQGLILFIFGDKLLAPAPDPDLGMKWTLYLIFNESMGYLFVAVIVVILLSILLKRRRA